MTSPLALKALTALQQALPPATLLPPNTTEFKTSNSNYLSQLESDIQPLLIFQPRTKEQISLFLKTLSPFIPEVQFAIRGAGCQPLPGCANIQDGITIDLSLLLGIEIRKNEGYVRIGAGETWGRVYAKLDGTGLGVCGGRSSAGGIGGLGLAGGLSFFSSREGFICDNILNYEVILASGDIINANENENADLWVSLRGGGNNFGIVTRFDFKTFKQGKIWGGEIYYAKESFPSQIKALVKELKDPNASKETHLMISIGWTALMPEDVMCLNQPYFTQPVENPAVLDPFTKIQTQIPNTIRLKSLKEIAEEQEKSNKYQVRCVYMNITVKAEVGTLEAMSKIYTDMFDEPAAAKHPLKEVEDGLFSFTLQPYPVSLLEKSIFSGGNSLGLQHSNGPLVSVLFYSVWKNKSDDDLVLGTMKQTLERVKQEAKSKEMLVPYVYMNYAFSHQDPVGSYGDENKERLHGVSKKYDPEGLFQKGCPGGFKLFT